MAKKLLIGCGGLILIVIIFAAIGSAVGGNKGGPASSPAANDKGTASAAASASAAATTRVLLDVQGTGTKTTQKFTAGGDWDAEWSYDCSNFGSQGNFIVTVYNSDGSPSFENQGINQLGPKGQDVDHFHHAGTFYLSISSECAWHVAVKG